MALSSSTIRSSILFQNLPVDIGFFDADRQVVTVFDSAADSDVSALGSGGSGNLVVDPLFVDADARDFRLSAASPSVGAGNPSGAPAVDHDGNPRDGSPDQGAFERQ